MVENIPSSVKDKTYRFRIRKHKRYKESHQGHHSRAVKQQKDLGSSKKKKSTQNCMQQKHSLRMEENRHFQKKWKQRMQLADPHAL